MSFIFKPIDEASVRQIFRWRYDPPYDIYNLPGPPDEAAIRYFLDPQQAVHLITNEAQELLGFCSFGPDGQVPGGDYSTPALDIGLGMRPDLTGQGHGALLVQAVLDFARRTFTPTMLRVTVAQFNRRALRVWEKAGFRKVQTFRQPGGDQTFIVLIQKV